MTNKELYDFAYNFLLSKKGVSEALIEKHFKPEQSKPQDLNALYKRLCDTAQNRQMSANVIGKSIGGIDNLKSLLFDFNPIQVAKEYGKDDSSRLLERIVGKLNPVGKIRTTPRSIWPQYCSTLIDSAHFLKGFENSEAFYTWADFFANNEKAKPALPLLISIEIRGIGFPLACDFLKEIGYTNFGKPDTYIKKIFSALKLIDSEEKSTLKQDYEAFKAIDKIAQDCNVSSFVVDKVFWLIGSGKFYETGFNIGRNSKEFLEEVIKKESM